MTRHPTLVNLCGLACMAAGAVTAGAPFSAHASASTRPQIDVDVVAGPSLVGARTTLDLDVSSAHLPGRARFTVLDLVPTGLSYLPGSSKLGPTGAMQTIGNPRSVATSAGRILVWSNLRLAKGQTTATLSLAVRADAIPATLTNGTSWVDRAAVYAARSGAAATSSPTGALTTPPAGDLIATAHRRIAIVPVWASETGTVSRTVPSPAVASGDERISEDLTVQSSTAGATEETTVRVYVPGWAAAAGCPTATTCSHPSITHVRLWVRRADPDQPLASEPAAATPSTSTSTTTSPATIAPSATTAAPSTTLVTTAASSATAPTTTAPPTTAPPTTAPPTTATPTTATPTTATPTTVPLPPAPAILAPASIRAVATTTTTAAAQKATTTLAPFTVLTWNLRTLAAGSHTTFHYRIDTSATPTARSEDVVTATGVLSVPHTATSTSRGTTPVVFPATASASQRPGTAVEATTLQAWPAAAADAREVGAGAERAARATTTSTIPTTPATVATGSPRDPFSPPGSTTTPTSIASGSTTTTTTVAAGTKKKKKASGGTSLASTGASVGRTIDLGLALSGGGVLLLLAGRRRPRPGPAVGPKSRTNLSAPCRRPATRWPSPALSCPGPLVDRHPPCRLGALRPRRRLLSQRRDLAGPDRRIALAPGVGLPLL